MSMPTDTSDNYGMPNVGTPYTFPLTGKTIYLKGGQGIPQTQTSLYQGQTARSQPALDQLYSYYSKLLAGGPELQAAVAPAAGKVNAQWDQALKTSVNSQYGRGGALDKAVRNVANGRAMSLADLYGNAQSKGASGLAALAGDDQAAAAGILGSARSAALLEQENRTKMLEGMGSLLTRILTEGGFGGSKGTPPYTPPSPRIY